MVREAVQVHPRELDVVLGGGRKDHQVSASLADGDGGAMTGPLWFDDKRGTKALKRLWNLTAPQFSPPPSLKQWARWMAADDAGAFGHERVAARWLERKAKS